MKKTVVICGDCGEKELTREIVRMCGENGGALVCDGDRIYRTAEDPFFLIFSVCTLSDLYLPGSVVVLGKALLQIRQDMNMEKCICILDGENRDAAMLAASSGAAAIGCSMSGHDTMTVSAFNEDDRAVITLRRRILTENATIEPCEFIVRRTDEKNIYPLLAASAVLLVSGKIPN